MFERFTDEARRVVVLAQEEARALDHNYIGTEHLFLGLLRGEDVVAARALTDAGIDPSAARTAIETTVGRGTDPPSGHLPFTPRAKRVMEGALREAVRLHNSHIGPEHLLLGLIREPHGVAMQVIAQQGVDLAALRAGVLTWVDEGAATGTEGITSISKADSTVRSDGVEDFLAPTCPGCRAAVEETAAFKTIDVPQEGGPEHIKVRFVFCEACGRTLTSKIIDA